jgi:hypothetical protein
MRRMAVPIGKATELLSGIVHAYAVVLFLIQCLPRSVNAKVALAFWTTCGISKYPIVTPPAVGKEGNVGGVRKTLAILSR